MAGRAFWPAYCREVASRGTPWLDQSNAAVHAQLISVSLEAARDLHASRCIDLGCGRGQLARALLALGADGVIAVDFAAELVEEGRRRFPEIDWRCGDASDAALIARLPRASRVFLVELLQYVDALEVLELAWDRVEPRGRLVGVVPHAGCPIVRQVEQRFGGRYRGLGVVELAELAARLPGLELWGVRGLVFAGDQRSLPYRVGPWGHDVPPEANRINFVLIKS